MLYGNLFKCKQIPTKLRYKSECIPNDFSWHFPHKALIKFTQPTICESSPQSTIQLPRLMDLIRDHLITRAQRVLESQIILQLPCGNDIHRSARALSLLISCASPPVSSAERRRFASTPTSNAFTKATI